ncbi:hypothetical protein K2X85_12125 [bacterium]|nr:hypothetical protein [bacterium]
MPNSKEVACRTYSIVVLDEPAEDETYQRQPGLHVLDDNLIEIRRLRTLRLTTDGFCFQSSDPRPIVEKSIVVELAEFTLTSAGDLLHLQVFPYRSQVPFLNITLPGEQEPTSFDLDLAQLLGSLIPGV